MKQIDNCAHVVIGHVNSCCSAVVRDQRISPPIAFAVIVELLLL